MIVSHLLEIILILTLGLLLAHENHRRDRIQSQDEGGMEGRDLNATAFSDLTDRENLKDVACFRFFCLLSLLLCNRVFGEQIGLTKVSHHRSFRYIY